AWDVKGKFLGKQEIIGAKNLPLTSFTQYMQSHPSHGDPDNIFELRNYIKGGRGKLGDLVNVCTWTFGNGASLPNCAAIDPKFMYSGDPETRTGWINTQPIDQRQMSNTGPFALEKGKPIDIVAVYIAGRGTNPLNSVTVAKEYSRTAQLVFDNNFPSPPPPPPVNVALTTGANFIDLDWPTADLIKYRARDTVLDVDRRFQGFFVTQYLTNAKTSSIQGVEAAKIVAHYQIHNQVRGVFQRKGNGGIDLVIEDLASEFKLDSLLYSNPSTGRIKVRLNKDAFTATPFIKGRDYYYTITTYTLNHSVIVNRATNTYGGIGEYIDMTGAGIDYYESPIYPITFGENLYTPALAPTPSTQTSGKSKGNVKLLVVDKAALTGDEYVVEFFPDTTAIPYAPFWRLRNVTRGTTLIDSSKVYDFDTTSYSGKVFQGFIPKVEPQLPVYPTNNNVQIQYISPNPRWFSDFSDPGGLGVFYAGQDLLQQPAGGLPTAVNLNLKSNVITADRLRTIEIRFGTPGKAYRFLRGYKGAGIGRRATVVYAGVVTAADTTRNAFGGGTVGKLGEGFVDVPFTAWVKDTVFGEERQLEVAFIEHSVAARGRPDGIWDTDTALLNTQEYIIVFDSPYSATPTNKIITGSGSTNWSDIRGYINNDATLTPFQVRTARSPWFNALYIVGLQQRTSTSYPTAGDILRIPMRVYPYTDLDKFTFRTLAQGQISEAQEREIFENVNVFPNPLFAFNPATSFDATANPDDPFVTFTNLPTEVTVKIYTLGGQLIRTLNESDKIGGVNSPFLRWDIENEAGLRAASGMYLAIVSSPKYGEKILKLAIIMPQKQLPRF
ncbi:MAG: hypothetical protein C0425_08010, partial [Chlorobiaceae bacterium]|nr:hypothetical protein [Chlorobiaceae bacterium]